MRRTCRVMGPNTITVRSTYDIRNVFHVSGGYELPFGTGKKYFANASKTREWRGRRVERKRDQWASGRPAAYVQLSN